MATRKKSKKNVFGMYTVTEQAERVVLLSNGLKIKLINGLYGEVTDVSITDVATGVEKIINGVALIQAADVLKSVDKSKRFVCGFHGSFVTRGRQQPAVCGTCNAGAISSHTLSVRDGEVQLEEEDA